MPSSLHFASVTRAACGGRGGDSDSDEDHSTFDPHCADTAAMGALEAARHHTSAMLGKMNTQQKMVRLLHTRLGHAPLERIITLLQHGIGKGRTVKEMTGMNVTLSAIRKAIRHGEPCEACILAKITQLGDAKASGHVKCKLILAVVHTDTAGPRRMKSIRKYRYSQLFIDEHTHRYFVHHLKLKSDLYAAMGAMEHRLQMDARESYQAEERGEIKVQKYRTDGDGMLRSSKMKKRLMKRMIDHDRSAPYRHNQNAFIERGIRTITDMARTMMVDSGLPADMWCYAIDYAVYVQNLLPCSSPQYKLSPHELWYGKPPDLTRIRTFGSVVYVWLPLSKRTNQDKVADPAGVRMRFVGIPTHNMKAYLCYDERRKHRPYVKIKTSVIFQEDMSKLHENMYADKSLTRREARETLKQIEETLGTRQLNLSSSSSDESSDDSSTTAGDSGSDTALSSDSDDTNDSGSSESGSSGDGSSDSGSSDEDEQANNNDTDDDQSSHDSNNETDKGQSSGWESDPHDGWTAIFSCPKVMTFRQAAKELHLDVELLMRKNAFRDSNGKVIKTKPTTKLQKGTELRYPEPADESTSSSGAEDAAMITHHDPGPERPNQIRAQEPAYQAGVPTKGRPGTQTGKGESHTEEVKRDEAIPQEEKAAATCDLVSAMTPDEQAMIAMQVRQAHEDAARLQRAAKDPGGWEHWTPHKMQGPTGDLLRQAQTCAKKAVAYFARGKNRQQRRQVRSAMSLFTDAAKAATSYWAMLVDELKHLKQRDVPQPKRYKDAIASDFSKFWKAAIQKEVQNMHDHRVFQWVRPVKGKRPIDYTWNFVCKPTKDGLIDKFKARLCARGFREVYGIHFTETHAPVTTLCSFRHCIAEAAEHDLLVELWDISGAYLREPLLEDIYFLPIDGFDPPSDDGDWWMKADKSIYGLKQAGRTWHKGLRRRMIDLGFKESEADPCLYIYKEGESFIRICMHVDDGCATFNDPVVYARVKADLIKGLADDSDSPKPVLSQSDDNDVYLGITIVPIEKGGHKGFMLHQERYVEDILAAFNMLDAKPKPTPYLSGVTLSKAHNAKTEEEKSEMADKPMRKLVGMLLHLTRCTRPDIACAVGLLARYQTNPGPIHWKWGKRILQYLSGTRDYGVVYGIPPQEEAHLSYAPLVIYCDADHAGDLEKRRSRTGVAVFSWGGVTGWTSSLQTCVALHTCEAEYVAACTAAKDAVWHRRLCLGFGYSPDELHISTYSPLSEEEYRGEKPVTIWGDNTAAIALAKNPGVGYKKNKHIEVQYHYTQSKIADGTVIMRKVHTDDNTSDIFTKPLETKSFTIHRDTLVKSMSTFKTSPFKSRTLSTKMSAEQHPLKKRPPQDKHWEYIPDGTMIVNSDGTLHPAHTTE